MHDNLSHSSFVITKLFFSWSFQTHIFSLYRQNSDSVLFDHHVFFQNLLEKGHTVLIITAVTTIEGVQEMKGCRDVDSFGRS